jgi:hypothetical protein
VLQKRPERFLITKKAIPFSDMAFELWLPIVDELRTFEGIFDETGTDSWK